MTDIRQAVLSLESALDEEYPSEFLDPAALRVVLDELKRLQGTTPHGDEMLSGDEFIKRWSTPELTTVNPWWMGNL
jgi:hypothetical protein